MRNTYVVAAAVLLSSIATAAERTAQNFTLSATLIDAGRIVGEPRLSIKAGEPATVTIGDAQGNRYAMTMTAAPQPGGNILIDAAIDFSSQTGGHQTAKPRMLVRVGQSSSIEFGRDDATTKPFRITFTLNPVTS